MKVIVVATQNSFGWNLTMHPADGQKNSDEAQRQAKAARQRGNMTLLGVMEFVEAEPEK